MFVFFRVLIRGIGYCDYREVRVVFMGVSVY